MNVGVVCLGGFPVGSRGAMQLMDFVGHYHLFGSQAHYFLSEICGMSTAISIKIIYCLRIDARTSAASRIF